MDDMNNNILEIKGMSKSFPGVQALRKVSFSIKQGEVHCLVGENGAGKSTLIKILAGAVERDEGEIFFCGERVEIKNVKEARNLGISVIFQELNVVNQLSVHENIMLGQERRFLGFIERKYSIEEARKHLQELGFEIDPRERVDSLSVAQKQMIEIARALIFEAKLIILDEPSASLGEKELERLFSIINKLKQKGVSFIYISHRLDEIFKIGDTVTVMRDGEVIGTSKVTDVSRDELVKMMVGRTIDNKYPVEKRKVGRKILEVRNLWAGKLLKNISFFAREREILGVFGLVGSGRTELARVIFGADPVDRGEILLCGEKVSFPKPINAIKVGIGLVPEERREQGLVLKLSVRENISLANLKSVSFFGFISKRKDMSVAKRFIEMLSIKTPSPEQIVANLSGGNQQKVVLSKWLNTNCSILLLDEPTRGIDVGTKSELYEIVSQLAKNGSTIIVFSSELEEVLGISDRIMVMHNGEIAACLNVEEATPEKVMYYATGGKQGEK